jgi:hypothetical protein
MHDTKPSEPTPEQLLKLLDLQIELKRSSRGANGPPQSRRVLVLMLGILFIVGSCFAALLLLQKRLADLPAEGASPAPRTGEIPAGTGKF